MAELRLSQIETLQVARELESHYRGSFEAADLACEMRGYRHMQISAARARLERLAAWGYMAADRDQPGRVFYTLTDKGRAALETP